MLVVGILINVLAARPTTHPGFLIFKVFFFLFMHRKCNPLGRCIYFHILPSQPLLTGCAAWLVGLLCFLLICLEALTQLRDLGASISGSILKSLCDREQITFLLLLFSLSAH